MEQQRVAYERGVYYTGKEPVLNNELIFYLSEELTKEFVNKELNIGYQDLTTHKPRPDVDLAPKQTWLI